MKTARISWATPLTIAAFIISGVTGLLLFFHIEIGMVEPVHKWLGWLMVGSVLFHVVANWKMFAGYFSKKPALGFILAGVLVALLSTMPIFGDEEKNNFKQASRMAIKALESSSLETVALVLKTDSDNLVSSLERMGFTVGSPSSSVAEIASANRKSEKEVLGALFGQPSQGKKSDSREGDGEEARSRRE